MLFAIPLRARLVKYFRTVKYPDFEPSRIASLAAVYPFMSDPKLRMRVTGSALWEKQDAHRWTGDADLHSRQDRYYALSKGDRRTENLKEFYTSHKLPHTSLVLTA
jgi:hypothetical protein